jgi:hypothetical protein
VPDGRSTTLTPRSSRHSWRLPTGDFSITPRWHSTIRRSGEAGARICVICPHARHLGRIRVSIRLDRASYPLAGRGPSFSATHGGTTQEQESGQLAIWLPDPAAHLGIARRKGRVVGRAETADSLAGRRRLRDDKQTRDVLRLPSSLPRDIWCQARLAVEAVKRRLRVGHHGLDLNDEDGLCRLVPGEDVDRAALAPDRERHLDGCHPAGIVQQTDYRVHQSCVSLVQQTVEAFAMPSKPDVKVRAQRCRHGSQDTNRHRVNEAALDLRDHSAGHVRDPAQVLLPEPFPNSKRPKPAAENEIHRASLAELLHPPIRRQFAPASLRRR